MIKYSVKKKGPVFVSILVLVGLCFFFSSLLLVDSLGNQEILTTVNPKLFLDPNQSYQGSQSRLGVQKNIWRTKGKQSLECSLNCAFAKLCFEKGKKRQTLTENMEDVHCVMQEELYYVKKDGTKTLELPRGEKDFKFEQIVRCFTAETAKYHYSEEMLIANQVHMQTFTLPGHEMPMTMDGLTPTIESHVETIVIKMVEKSLQFQANKFIGSASQISQ